MFIEWTPNIDAYEDVPGGMRKLSLPQEKNMK